MGFRNGKVEHLAGTYQTEWPIDDRERRQAEQFFPRALFLLERTRPWLVVISLFYFLVGTILTLLCLGLLLHPDLESGDAWFGLIVSAFLATMSHLVGFACVTLVAKIRRYMIDRTPLDLDRVLVAELRVWQLIGIHVCGLMTLGFLGGSMGLLWIR